jgi:magnesium-transporting ATPase (P-type)
MTIKVKNSQQSYKYPLDYNQLLLRGSSLKTTHWVYGIVVYTGKETKCKMHDAAKDNERPPKKTSRMQKMMDAFILYLLFI